jgi:hypothetical protein
LAAVFKIDENSAFFVADGEFGLSIQLDGSAHRPLGGIDPGRVKTSAVEGARWILNNRVGILTNLNFAEQLEPDST